MSKNITKLILLLFPVINFNFIILFLFGYIYSSKFDEQLRVGIILLKVPWTFEQKVVAVLAGSAEVMLIWLIVIFEQYLVPQSNDIALSLALVPSIS